MGAGGARRGDGIVRSLGTQVDGQETGNHIDDRTGDEERRNAPWPLVVQRAAGLLDIGQTANTRTHGHADALTVGIGDFEAGVTHRLETGCQAVLNEQVEFAGFFGRQVFFDVEAFYRAAKTGGIGRKVRVFDQTNATAASQNALPGTRNIGTQWRQHPHTGDYDASTRHSTLLYPVDDTLPHT